MRSVMFVIDTSEEMSASKDNGLKFFKDNAYYTTDQPNFNKYVGLYPLYIFEGRTYTCSLMEPNLDVKNIKLNLEPKELDELTLEEALTRIYDAIEVAL